MVRRYSLRLVSVFIVLALLISPIFAAAPESVPQPEVHGTAAILVDLDDGEIYFEKNKDQRVYPASLTKVMTAILVIEHGGLSDVVTASETALKEITADDSRIKLSPGEQMTVENLLYALLLASANDSAMVLAEHVAGSTEAFVAEMNQKAAALGMTNSHFVNPHGMPDDNHYTTAADYAKLCIYAMKNDTFRQLVSTSQKTLPATNLHPMRILYSTNQLICRIHAGDQNIYHGAMGIKTGTTMQAGKCFAGAVKQNDIGLLAVTFQAGTPAGPNYAFSDVIRLFDYGFSRFPHKNLLKKGDPVVEAPIRLGKQRKTPAVADRSFSITVKDYHPEKLKVETKLEQGLTAPVNAGTVLGKAIYTYDGARLGTTLLLAGKTVELSPLAVAIDQSCRTLKKPVVAIPIILIALLLLWLPRKKRKRKRRHRHDRQN